MKRVLYFGLILTITMSLYPIYASEDWGGSIGVSYWKPEWDRENMKGTTNGILGPTAMIRYKSFSLSAQYFTGKYDLEFEQLNDTYSADRTDLDIALSYRFMRFFNVAVGYKIIEFDWNATYALDTEISGLALGLGASYTFPKSIFLYSSLSYMPALDYEWNYGGIKDSNDADGLTFEAGIGYVYNPLHVITKLGYRYQEFNIDDDPGVVLDETNDGFRIELGYLF